MRVLPRLLSGVALLATSAAFAQSSATLGSVPAHARILTPITLTLANSGLDFGDIAVGGTAGTVQLAPATDTRTPAGAGVTVLAGSPFNSAQLTVAGQRNYAYTITLPATPVTLTHTVTPANTMTVTAFTAAIGAAALTAPFTGLLPNTGAGPYTQTFKVGGTLNVNANQLAGDYNGTFSVTVAYN